MSCVKIFLILLGVTLIDGANILIIFNALSKSHHILGDALGLGLAEKGHEVTMISPFKSSEKHPNYKEIILDGEFDPDMVKKRLGNVFEKKQSVLGLLPMLLNFGFQMANGTLYHPKVVQLLESDAKFDVVIAEVFLNECLLGFAQHFNAIPIMMGTGGAMTWSNKMVGNPSNPAYDIIPFTAYGNPMTYLERLGNTVFRIVEELFYWYHIRVQNDLYNSYFRHLYKGSPSTFPHLSSLVSNVSLVLLNSNIAVSNAQALVPNMVNVGGLHIKTKKLPKDLQKILDDSKHGVVYFSMGSNLRSTQLPSERRDAILKTFSKLKHTVLWKWEDDKLPNQPSNVIIRPWMPQQSILDHPNVKVFITHGGLLSSIEALYFGIPLIGIPIIGDQHMNMARATKSGYGLKLDLNDITEKTLTEALNMVINEPSYGLRAKELSKIFRDEAQSPIDKAVSSVEYVLRHKGARFLRSPAADMSLYQKLLLDVIFGLIVIISVPIALLFWVVKRVCRLFKKDKTKTVIKKKMI